ncbi:MAG: hypothetical protein ACT4PV_06915 [Planctomycetaceae bacterium]
MNRTLVALVLLLTGFVAVLTVMVFGVKDQVDSAPSSRSGGPSLRPVTEEQAAQADELRLLRRDVVSLKAQIADLERRRASEAERSPATSPDPAPGSGDPERVAAPDRASAPPAPERDAQGDWVITDEQVEYAAALQREVDRRRRQEGMARNVMRRIDSLAARGEIAAVQDQRRTEVEAIVKKYVARADDVVQRIARNPGDADAALTAEARRDLMQQERDQLAAAARQELVPLVGERDAGEIAENALISSYFPRNNPNLKREVRRVGDG